ncbi:LytR/AlgR family response regulator transcription factor [Parafilimonas sp.]|uniref:LytR/AlgR family response regulator transcription factor n=1 Tax=Parafilimonas sp. TaxID=1969739 RepID=UPI0039E2F1CB
MQVVIIEDESYTANYLKELLTEIDTDIRVIRIFSTIAESVAFFRNGRLPDLIFCDVHLADGLGFEIFKTVPVDVPVIFVTAHEQYALQAFKTNGIGYILKPFSQDDIAEALAKYRWIYTAIAKKIFDYERVFRHVADDNPIAVKEVTSLLIKFGEKIRPVKIADIAYFNTENKSTSLVTLNNQKYHLNKPLDEIEKMCGDRFYRVNRQVLLNKEAVDEVLQGYSRKLMVKLKVDNAPDIIINKTKMTDFLVWLSS